MAAVSLFWDTSMAAVTSCENTPYLDRRTVTKLEPAECSQGYLNRVVRPKKELYVPARKAVERIVRPLKPEM